MIERLRSSSDRIAKILIWFDLFVDSQKIYLFIWYCLYVLSENDFSQYISIIAKNIITCLGSQMG